MTHAKKRVVVIGGGTGTYTLLRGLKAYAESIDITAIVTMADSGGSTGRLRDEFGQLPVGDVRMALCALATEIDSHSHVLRELFLYRFAKGDGLTGHNFGNLLLTALTEIVGDTSLAIETAGQILRTQGSVIPVTTDNVQLMATFDSGRVVVGEHAIDVCQPNTYAERIMQLGVVPNARGNEKAIAAIYAADIVVLGPGDLYTSILANCVVGGISEALLSTSAKLLFVCNLMSRLGQTIGMHSLDYVTEIEKYISRKPDCVIFNQAPTAPKLLQKYIDEGNHLVEQTISPDFCSVRLCDIVTSEAFVTVAGDTLERSLIRHDGQKLAQEVMLFFTE